MDVRALCAHPFSLIPISGELIRIVESQEQIATSQLVDDLAKQALLEQMLEQSKPEIHVAGRHLHYLLSTPFRYPPLPWGSRFGSALEPGLFYGSKRLQTTLAEAAFYRFIFWHDMAVAPAGKFVTQHAVFGVSYHTDKGLQLQGQAFADYQVQLTHTQDYAAARQVGRAMREQKVEAFEYVSARDPGKGVNVALFTPRAFASPAPNFQQDCLCETRADTVVYSGTQMQGIYQFGIELFQVNGRLPRPAA